MDSVESMKLSSIIKNRKAMTPLMIGIIVAASLLSTFLMLMTITIPLSGRDLDMSIKEAAIRGNTTDNIQLSFRVICDYDKGILKEVEILRTIGDTDTIMGYRYDNEITFQKSEEFSVTYNFTANPNITILPPEGVSPDDLFIFGNNFEYILRIRFEDETGEITGEKDYTFTFGS